MGRNFKVYGTSENPLFLAKDVAEWIDYSFSNKEKGIRKVSQMLQTIDEDEKVLGVTNVVTQNTWGGLRENQERWFLTEDGLYEVLMQSRKPIAKAFKKEVKKINVAPNIYVIKNIYTTLIYVLSNVFIVFIYFL